MLIFSFVCKIYNHELWEEDLVFSLHPLETREMKSEGPCVGEGKSFAFSVHGKHRGVHRYGLDLTWQV